MLHAAETWTASMVRALPDDGKRYEAVDGELLVTPVPGWPHQRAVLALTELLNPYIRAHLVGELVISPADVELDRRTLVQPDLFVVPLVDGRRMRSWADIGGRILLAIEVISPSSARADRHMKRHRYQSAGIPEYWVVDLDARAIERWRAGDQRSEMLTEALTWTPPGAAGALTLDLRGLFAGVLDG